MAFEAGEVVQLKSGGPAMTVAAVDSAGVHCVWYGESDDQIHAGVIAAVALDEVHLANEDEDEDDEDEHEAHK